MARCASDRGHVAENSCGEVLLEVHGWTGFLDDFSHAGGLGPRMDDLPVSVAALLVAEACNVGLTPVTDPIRTCAAR